MHAAGALGLSDQIGSIEVGKNADLIAVDLSGPETQPCPDVVSQLVYCAGREHVNSVWVAGDRVVADRRIMRNERQVDYEPIAASALYWQARVHAADRASPLRVT